MAREKFYKKVTVKHIKILFGIILILGSIFGLLNYTFASTAMVYGMVYLFGNLYFLPFAIVIYFGFTLIYKPLFKKAKKAFVILGFFFLILSLSMCLTYFANPVYQGVEITAKELNFENFYDCFTPTLTYRFNNPVNVFDINQGGGLLGYFLVASFNSLTASYIATMAVGSILFFVALLFFLYFPIKALVIYVKDNNDDAVKKFKKKNPVNVDIEQKTLDNANNEVEEETEEFETEEEIIIPTLEKANDPVQVVKKVYKTEEVGFVKPSFDIFDINHTENVTEMKENPAPINKPIDIFQNLKVEEPEKPKVINDTPKQNYTEPVNNYFEDEEEQDELDYSYGDEFNNEFNYTEDYDENDEPEVDTYESKSENKSVNSSVESTKVTFLNENVNINKNENTESEQTDNRTYNREIITDIESNKDDFTGTIVINRGADRPYEYPPLSLLKECENSAEVYDENVEVNNQRLEQINSIFDDLGIGAKATSYEIGPSVTRFNILPNSNVSISVVEKYISDLSSRLGGLSVRFEKIVEGRMGSALEIPNHKIMMVTAKEGIQSLPKNGKKADFNIAFGRAIDGKDLYAKLNKFPHLLVSGTTGSGKSVFLNSLLVTLIMRNSPDQLKLFIVDPKDVEFTRFNGIPHLLGPVINKHEKVKIALERLADEMDNRHAFLRTYDFSEVDEFNEAIDEGLIKALPKIPTIVCILDEFADLIDKDKTIMNPVQRLAAKGRTASIHLVIATQRASTNCVTGTVKSNINTRVAFMAASQVDSRVMFDKNGAENLAGNGDMLIRSFNLSRNSQSLIRAQGYFITKNEVRSVLQFLKERYSPEYDKNFTNLTILDNFSDPSGREQNASSYNDSRIKAVDEIYDKVREEAYKCEYFSISAITRLFGVGFTRAGKLFHQLTEDGILNNEDIAGKGRKVLIHSEFEFTDHLKEMDEEFSEEIY